MNEFALFEIQPYVSDGLHNSLGEGAVAGLDLGEVLPDGCKLYTDPAGGGGELGEVEGGDVGGSW